MKYLTFFTLFMPILFTGAKAAPADAEIDLLHEEKVTENGEPVTEDGEQITKHRVTEVTYSRKNTSSPLPGTSSPVTDEFQVDEHRVEFSPPHETAPDIGKGFSNALGWTLWKTKDTSLCEVDMVTAFDDDKLGKEQLDKASTLVYNQKEGFKNVNAAEYSAWGLKQRLGLFGPRIARDPKTGAPVIDSKTGKPKIVYTEERGSAIMLSIRDSFSYFNASQEGFGINYTKNNGESSWNINGAIMMDFYLDPLYNRENLRAGWGNPYRFWFRTGVEFDRNDAADVPTDRTSFYLLSNFQANPNQKARLLGLSALPRIISPQFLQLGAAWDHDERTNDDEMRWIVGWQPQFYAVEDIGFIAESFGINRNMFFEKGGFAKLFTPSEAFANTAEVGKKKPSNYYSSIPVDLRLSGGSDILAQAFQGADSADDALLEWKAGFLFGHGPKLSEGVTNARWRIGYFAEGATPLFDPGETHMGHRFVAEVGFGNLSQEFVDNQKANSDAVKKKGSFEFTDLPTTSLGAMTVFAEYKIGAPPPTYQKEDIFQIGTRIRF